MRKLKLLFFMMIVAALVVGCASAPVFQFNPGLYTGVGQGWAGPIHVTVEVDNSRILSVTIGQNHETQSIASAAFDRVPRQIVERQSVHVDAMAGVTLTVDGIVEAVTAALISAGATEEQLAAGRR